MGRPPLIRGPVLAVIPARGGSKGIPRKNVKPLGGKPLLAYSIEVGLRARGVSRLLVDTDDAEIAAVARKHGAEAPWLRPRALATDKSQVTDAVLHLLGRLEKEQRWVPAAILLLQPTSPFRTAASIERGLHAFRRGGGESVVSVRPMTQHPYLARRLRPDGHIEKFFPRAEDPARRQDLPTCYMLDGSIFITTPAKLRAQRSFYGRLPIAVLTPPGESLDIDTPADWEFAEFLLRRGGAGIR